ncbi:EspA/EspE family type VII secretion system effector [Mycobacterium marinum]|uniref:EspA/EspE family type VII secretion system effector n=1 Tax=Mycobacterium marinum TaxID=1781 RepID=UPI003FEEF263
MAYGSVLCAAAEGVLGVSLALLGVAFPDPGDRLVSGGSMFDEFGTLIAALVPEAGWQGAASRAYIAQALAQSQRAKLMGELDRLVSSQADAVKAVRYAVAAEMVAVAITGAYCVYQEGLGPTGLLMSARVALVVCTLAMLVLVGCLIYLLVTTARNTRDLHAAGQRLTDMLALLPNSLGAIPAPADMALPPPPSRCEANATASIPHIPDATVVFARLPGSPMFSLPPVASPGFPDFGAPCLPIPQLVGTPTQPDLPSVLAKLPTMTQLNNLTGPTSTVRRLANTVTQPAQMVSTLAQQGGRAPVDAEARSALQHQERVR